MDQQKGEGAVAVRGSGRGVKGRFNAGVACW